MRWPSTRTATVMGVGLTLATAAANGLHAPTGVWIGAAVAAGGCFVAAVVLHISEGRTREQQAEPVLPLVDRLRPALSEGLALAPRLDPATPSLDVLQPARAWQNATYGMLADERRDLAKRFLDAGEPIEVRETQSLASVNPARLIIEHQTTALKGIAQELEVGR